MENIHYALAAVILLAAFYLIALLVHTIWTTMQDDDFQ